MTSTAEEDTKEEVVKTLPVEENTKEEAVTTPMEEKESPLSKAEKLYENEKLLEAARVLNSITDKDIVFGEKHFSILEDAKKGQELVDDLKADPGVGNEEEGGWVDHGVSGGKFPTRLLHRLEKSDKCTQLRARCETPISKDLLSPLISVLNETELYESWMPSWTTPRFGLRKCEKLKQIGRCSQVLHIIMDLPWPMSPREFTMHVIAFDDIEENGDIGIKINSVTDSDKVVGDIVPKPGKKSVLLDLDGGFVFTSCPKDHPSMKEIDSDEEMVLIRFNAMMDPKLKLLPQSFLNFLVKVAFVTAWKIMLGIALDVKNGKRPAHAKAISAKDELYAWIDSRLDVMLSLLKGMTGSNVASVA